MKKFYAVRKGRTPGVFDTWNACKASVHGYSGAVYKSFPSREEAEAFVTGGSVKQAVTAEMTAYVDGSYDLAKKMYSYGVVLIHNGHTQTFAKAFDDAEMLTMRNVAGEIKGAEMAMAAALEKGVKSLAIYHDYTGIEKWCNGEWKATKPGTIAYAAYFASICHQIDIQFVKVKSHSGDRLNDLADQLAKDAIQKYHTIDGM